MECKDEGFQKEMGVGEQDYRELWKWGGEFLNQYDIGLEANWLVG